MAQKIVTTTYSDLSGAEGANPFRFGVDGLDYEADLTPQEEDKVRAFLADIIGVARKLPRASGGSRPARRAAGDAATRSDRSAKIRAWARDNGFNVNDRGRVSAEIVAAYDAAH